MEYFLDLCKNTLDHTLVTIMTVIFFAIIGTVAIGLYSFYDYMTKDKNNGGTNE